MLILSYRQGIPQWNSITEGSVLNNSYTKGILQNVADDKVVLVADYNGLTFDSYTSTGTTINLDATTNISTGGIVGNYDAIKLDDNKMVFTTDDWSTAGKYLAYVVTTGSGTIATGPKFTYNCDSAKGSVARMDSNTVAFAARTFSSPNNYLILRKATVTGDTITSDFGTNMGTNWYQPIIEPVDSTHAVVVMRNLDTNSRRIKVFNMGVSAWTQVGTSAAMGFSNFGGNAPVIIRLRDDGDGIVYVYRVHDASIGIKARAFKVNSSTYAITVGPNILELSGTYNDGSQRAITRLTDDLCMATTKDTYNVLSVDASLNIAEESSQLYTKVSSGQYSEVELLADYGNKVLHRNNLEMRIAEPG